MGLAKWVPPILTSVKGAISRWCESGSIYLFDKELPSRYIVGEKKQQYRRVGMEYIQ